MTHTSKPKSIRLFLVRHGLSEANVDLGVYKEKPDSAIELAPQGWQRVLDCGLFLRDFFKKNPPTGEVALWHSSYMRARQTAQGINEGIKDIVTKYREEDTLVEQKFGVTDGLTDEEWKEKFPEYAIREEIFKRNQGRHFFAYPGGESRADVSERCKIVFDNIHRAHHQGVNDFVIVTHGATLRSFVKEWLRIRHEDMAKESNPDNCDIRYIEAMIDHGYVFHKGVAKPAKTIRHKTDKEYFEKGAYFPSFAERPALVAPTGKLLRIGNGTK